MQTPAADWLEALLHATGSGRIGRSWQCPSHADATPSLGVKAGSDGRALVHCRAGCDTRAVLAALGIGLRQLFTPPDMPADRFARLVGLDLTYPPVVRPSGPGRDPAWKFESAHEYGDRWRLVRHRHPSGDKHCVWETLDQSGAWIPGMRGIPTAELPLYRDTELRMAVAAGELVFLVESESSADALATSGRYSTTWAGGASSPPLTQLATALAGAHLVLVPDNDDAGIRCAQAITSALESVTATFRTVWPDAGQDARDLLANDPGRLR